MTARLLPRDKLIPLLCRWCYGESSGELTKSCGITKKQLWNLLAANRDTLEHMRKFLGFPRRTPRKPPPKPKIVPGIWRKCNRCREEFWTESKFIFSCTVCHRKPDFNDGCDYTTTAWRGAG